MTCIKGSKEDTDRSLRKLLQWSGKRWSFGLGWCQWEWEEVDEFKKWLEDKVDSTYWLDWFVEESKRNQERLIKFLAWGTLDDGICWDVEYCRRINMLSLRGQVYGIIAET